MVRRRPRPRPGRDPTVAGERIGRPLGFEEAVRGHIRAALARSKGKIHGPDGAAALLGLKPSTLRSRMKRLGLHRESP